MKIYDYNGKKNICGDRLREARVVRRLRQEDLAAQIQLKGINMERDSISRIEIGTRFVSDFELKIFAEVLGVSDAIEMARDAIGLMGIDMQDDGEALPEASSIASAQAEAPSGAIVSLVDVDFAEYRRKNDMRVVKKNCTIPSWLNFEAERAGVNFSAVLQAALKSELHITSR